MLFLEMPAMQATLILDVGKYVQLKVL